jgi:hypothetical protein
MVTTCHGGNAHGLTLYLPATSDFSANYKFPFYRDEKFHLAKLFLLSLQNLLL